MELTLENDTRLRVRRLDPRNLVIERQRPDGLWLIIGYYGTPLALARALLEYELDPGQAETLGGAIEALRLRVEDRSAALGRQIERLQKVEI
jgi:hypothetical protein